MSNLPKRLKNENALSVPSRELDALVAERVMGWELKFVGAPSYVWTERDTGIGRAHEDHWNPSVDIHYAWQVVEKLANPIPYKGHDFTLCGNGRTWTADFASDDAKNYIAEADTAPLAICLAALQAVGSPK